MSPFALLDALAHSPPELIWGLLSRGIGLVYLISFASLAPQLLPIAGRRGVTPVHDTLRAIERDFPTWKRFLYFPTLLWIHSGDAALVAINACGLVAAAAAIVGGPASPWALFACYVCYLSLDRAVFLVYPWDCLLFEAGFWGLFLPATELLPRLESVAAPLPAVAWVYRLLVFRVMLGFGKHKFFGSTPEDSGFLKSFMVGQPLPTPLGWWSQKLPMPILKLSLIVMFLVEIPMPFAVFFPGWPSALAALAMIGLMVAIQLTGNFGYFNIAMVVVTLSWFDSETAEALTFAGFFSPEGPLLVHVLVVLHTLLAALAFPFNTFCAQTWMSWSPIARVRPKFLMWPATLARLAQPFRTVHAYGVFPPHSPPAIKLSPVTEVTWDGKDWHPLVHRFWPTLETSPPRFCAPHHDRFDQAVVYEALGLNEANVFRNVVGRWDPYGHGGVPAPLMMLRRMLEGTLPGAFYDRSLEERKGPPVAVRVRTYMFEPTTSSELKESGRWWRRTLVGPHFAPMTLDDGHWDAPLPPPELWHFEDIFWLRRSHLGAAMKRVAHGEDPHALVTLSSDLREEHVRRFWDQFLPLVGERHKEDWGGLNRSVQELRDHYGRAELHRFERVANRYAILLLAKLEPAFVDKGLAPAFGKVRASLDVQSWYHLRLLTHHIVGEGRAAYDAVIAEPRLAEDHARRMTLCSGNRFMALFRYETLLYQAQKLRLMQACLEYGGRPEPTEKQREAKARLDAIARRLFGVLDVADFLRTQFTGEEDTLDVPERWPRFTLNQRAEVVRLPFEHEGERSHIRSAG